ncbi:hypothetical protein [Janthinobacterium sp.]|uniref:hypothetical protein n=1 Tax=Janthinobacterium sp. TaxID=1871054 RepID=UPI002898E77D|nr:hypothetical protein [Janthinobacterium sp.]
MLQSFADYHKIPPDVYAATGAFDPILGIDTQLFIDPRLVLKTSIPEFEDSHQKISEHFANVMRVVKNIEKKNDPFWKTADRMLTFPEVKGLCIGYAAAGSNGSGMGKDLRENLLENIIKIVRAGVDDPALFELVGIFQDKVGPDRISDMIAKLILPALIAFTQRVCSDCGIPMESCTISKQLQQEDLPVNPLDGSPIILVPNEILRDLPVASDYGDVAVIAAQNQFLRDELNAIVGSSMSHATLSDKKQALRNTFVAHPEILQDLLKAYLASDPEFYDFKGDPAGEVIWYRASRGVVENCPLNLTLSAKPTIDDVEKVVLDICEHFRMLVEDNQLARLLYDKNGVRKHESAAQLLFFGIASAYCTANGLDLSPESDAGRGPVDFKISSGFNGKVLVEIKLTSNNQLMHGFENQLPIYIAAEGAQRGIYFVIDNGGCSPARMKKFKDVVFFTKPPCPRVIMIDGSVRESASKAEK